MRVLITGENSYAGRQFEKRVADLNMDWQIDFVSVRNDSWKEKDFSYYDAVYHVAAIVHQKEIKENESLYYQVNRDLTYQLALKAKEEGVKTFIFLSTMAVYGLIGKIGEDTVISKETEPKPTSYYGKSKLEAEKLINDLRSSEFNVSILRIPMIYGPNCPGNYSSLSKLAKKTPIFPKISNRRSMIFINHLTDIVIHLIKTNIPGVFLVSNPEDIDTLEMVKSISENHKRKIYYSSFLGFIIKKFGNHFIFTRKIFGNLTMKIEINKIQGFKFKQLNFENTVKLSEKVIN